MVGATQRAGGQWDTRIHPGLDVRGVSREVRGELAQALGELGVEAEYFLAAVAPFTSRDGTASATRQAGEQLLWQLETSGQRIIRAADAFEVATQAFLGALEARQPDLRPGVRSDGTWEGDLDPAWWPDTDTSTAADGPVALNLRRCGFSYRHAVAAHLEPNVAGIGENMALLLHALGSLPPVGVLPVGSLYAGLYELTEAIQGHMVPHHLRDVSQAVPGLLTGITLLRRLDASEDRSLEADIAWAQSELARVDAAVASQPPSSAAASTERRGFLGIFRRGPARGANAATSAKAFANQARQEWTELVRALEVMRRQPGRAARR